MNDSKVVPDLSKLIKRLDLIKGLISLEEQDEITTHVEKLRPFESSAELRVIIDSLDSRKWVDAIEQIEDFVKSISSIDRFVDPKVAAVKMEVKNLENSVGSLQSEIAETEKTINQFLLAHNQHLGPVIIKILELKKERLKSLADDQEGKDKWEEANREYEDYQNQMDDSASQEMAVLNDEQKAELKTLYKKAALMCHPDKVSDELREMAEQIFKELNEANSKNNLNRVREIHDDLLKQKFQSRSDTVNEYDQLLIVRTSLQSKQKALLAELRGMKETDTYQTITGIEDWDEYFQSTKEVLEEQLNGLLTQTSEE
jgi:hypothetical protein